MNETSVVMHILKTMGPEGLIIRLVAAPTVIMVLMYLDHRKRERERTEATIRYEQERTLAIKADAEQRSRWIEDRASRDQQHQYQIETIQALHQEELTKMRDGFMGIITQQQARIEQVVKQYENNVVLVEGYQKLANDLAGIITLNTQTLTRLVEKVENNQAWLAVRDGAKHGV